MPKPAPTSPSAASTLSALPQVRIRDLGRVFGVRLRSVSSGKKQLASLLGSHLDGHLPVILRELGREEPQAVCRADGVDHRSATTRPGRTSSCSRTVRCAAA
ncbi:MAG: hypothetical protein M3Y87_20950 [Myxococcota bacterium]|nr:hypothetical protein [Myxococcota bacterium]